MAMMKKLTSALVASSLVLGLVGTAGATTPDKVNTAASRMATLGLVQGKGGPDLALGDSITRAELVTVIVRAFGHEKNAQYLNGVNTFPDTANHWASGYVTMAHKLITERSNGTEVMGYPDGTFKPDGQVTAAEAIAFLMKFVGAPKDNSLPYPDNYLQGAVNAGLISAEDLANIEGIKNAPATRGLAFYLADSAFSSYKLAEGSTVYRTFVDTVGPELTITTEAPAVPTLESKITISGTVSGAELVFVGTPANAATINDGAWTIDVDLAMGENNIVVTAVDLVGNTTERTLKVTRTVGDAAAIEAEDIAVAAGETIDVSAAVVDAKGNVLEGAVITGESAVGTYADGKFTAGTKAGEGTLILKSGDFTKEVKVTITPAVLSTVKAAHAFAPGEPVQLIGVDAYGNKIDGVTFSEDSADAYLEGDRLVVTKEGSYTITGTLGDIIVTGTIDAYGDVAGLAVEASKAAVVANNASTVTVTVKPVDANGNHVPNFEGYVRYEGDLTVTNDDEVVVDEDYALAEIKDGVATFVFKVADLELAGEEAELEFGLYETYSAAAGAANSDRVAEEDFTIEVAEQEATAIKLDAPKYLPVNIEDYEATVEVIVLDQDGEEMIEAEDYDFQVKINGPAMLIDEDGDEDDEAEFEDVSVGKNAADSFKIRILPNDDEDTGTVTISVTSKGLESAMATIEAVVARAAKSIQLTGDSSADVFRATKKDAVGTNDEYAEYTVQLLDRNGVPTSNEDGATVKIELDGVSYAGSVYYADLSADNPTWMRASGNSFELKPDAVTGKVKFALATMFAGTIKVSAEDVDEDLTSSKTVETEFSAGDAKYIAFKHKDLNFLSDASAKTTVVAQLYDEFGNPVAKRGVEVTINVKYADGQVRINGDKIAADATNGKDIDLRTDSNGRVVLDVVTSRAADEVKLEITEVSHGVTMNIPAPAADQDPDLLFASLSDEVTLRSDKRVADFIDIVVVDANGKKVTRVTPGQEYNVQITVKDDNKDPFDIFADPADNDDDYIIKLSTNLFDLPGVYLPLVAVTDDQNQVITGVYTLPTNLELPELSVDELTFTAEIMNVEKALSDSVTVKMADEHSTYKFVANSSFTFANATNWAVPVTIKYDKKLDRGYKNAQVYVTAYNSVTKAPVPADSISVTTKDAEGNPVTLSNTWTISDLAYNFSQEYTISVDAQDAGKYKIELTLVAGTEELASKTITVTQN